ncbi:hypothetical protein C8R41DRAFT_864661 [Lentinula lateritia]|uniref:Uncharacterized protein n=1 Tax=Lentinula lateritia TaxID=40482 RepID=A0ABQ8VQ98_9AGAR|nr:hypothetical protein C8R41DRAFT_864661 [Lentinula lateritia]
MATHIQLCYFAASDAFIKNGALFMRGLLRATVSTTGNTNAYWGVQEPGSEGVRAGYLITAWHSQGDYDKYQNSNASDTTMRLLEEVALGEITSHLFTLGVKESSTIPTLTFQAKLTEFVLASPKEGVPSKVLKRAIGKVCEVLDEHGHPSMIGENVTNSMEEAENVYVIVIGWPAYEIMDQKPFVTPIDELSSFAELRFWHVPFDTYTSRL